MPCRTDDCFDTPRSSSGVSTEKYNSLKIEADLVTRLLCSVMGTLEKHDYPMDLSIELGKVKGLNDWWENHKEIDRKRIEKEVEAASSKLGKVLDNLSPEARDILLKQLQK